MLWLMPEKRNTEVGNLDSLRIHNDEQKSTDMSKKISIQFFSQAIKVVFNSLALAVTLKA